MNHCSRVFFCERRATNNERRITSDEKMCLGIPVKVIKKKGLAAEVEIEGVKRQANLTLRPEAKVGDYVLLHAGFAIEILDTREAQERLKLLHEMADGKA